MVDLGLMDTMEIDPETRQLTVGPGTRFLDIHRELRAKGPHPPQHDFPEKGDTHRLDGHRRAWDSAPTTTGR